jgi:CheY-like chemotaxis protein
MHSEKTAQRIFVKVVGFTDVERHALNTVFRLSEQRGVIYSLWQEDAPAPPRLALVDGQSDSARRELAAAPGAKLKMIWVGTAAPDSAWRTFDRPLSWSSVLDCMDELFAPPDFIDLGLGWDHCGPAGDDSKRALIASTDRNERLYLRAKLALAGLTRADEAETGARALELAREHRYVVAVVNFALPDVNGWIFLKELMAARPAIPNVIMSKATTSTADRVRAWVGGAKGCFDKPPHPGKLHDLLLKVQRDPAGVLDRSALVP